MLRSGAEHTGQRDGLVNADEAAAVMHGQGQQVEVGDLVVALNPGEVEEIVVAQGNIIGPEVMVQHATGFAQPFAHLRNGQSAAAAKRPRSAG